MAVASTRPFYRTLSWKFGSALLFTSVLGGALMYWRLLISSEHLREYVTQTVNWGVAEELAHQIEPLLQSNDEEALNRALYAYTQVNPDIDVGIVSTDGKVLHEIAPYHIGINTQIDTSSIELALKNPSPNLPLYGPALDSTREKQKSVFSVAKIQYRGETAYLYLMLGFQRRGLYQRIGQFYVLNSVLLGLALAMLASLIMGSIILYFLTRNMKALVKTANEIREGNRFIRAEVRGNDEFADVARAMNKMVDHIVTQTRELEISDMRRRELVAHISHDLRSPLTVAISNVDSLLEASEGTALDVNQKGPLERTSHALKHQKELIDNLFELSKLDSLDLKPSFESFSLVEMLNDLLEEYTTAFQQNAITVEFIKTDELNDVYADPALLIRALRNLIDNAIKYSTGEKITRFTLRAGDDMLEVSIENSSEELTEQEVKSLSEPFFRATSLDVSGAGLGLTIVRRILELHGSTIRVEYREDAMLAFSFELSSGPENKRVEN